MTNKTIDQKTLSLSRQLRDTNDSTIEMATPRISKTTQQDIQKDLHVNVDQKNTTQKGDVENVIAGIGLNPRHHRLFAGSSYDRYADIVLRLWPRIIEKFPDATLEVCYGWNLYDLGYADNEERQDWKARMNKLMEQKGITHHGRVSKKELKKIRESCGIWIYPAYFAEINCITALEAQASGLVPVVTNYAALKETVQSGAKVDGDIYDDDVQEAWLSALFEYMGDEEKWKTESEKATRFAQSFDWLGVSKLWANYFNE